MEEILRMEPFGEEAGYKSVQWDASGVASGVFLYRLTAGSFVGTRKMVVVK